MGICILQKDLSDIKAGVEFTAVSALAYAYIVNGKCHIEFVKEIVENNPEWFKLKEERVVISDLHSIYLGCGEIDHRTDSDGKYHYSFKSTHDLSERSNSAIIKAIEFIVNGGDIKYVDGLIEKGYAPLSGTFRVTNSDEKYTEEDMRKCFNDARDNVLRVNIHTSLSGPTYVYSTFEDYINSLK